MSKIAFIGLGHMGVPMALNLVKAGHALVVHDLLPAGVAQLTAAGAHAAESAKDAVSQADIVITMLPASQHVEGLYLRDDLLAHIDPRALVIDCSTIAPETSRKVADAALARGISMLDAPVSGGTAGAAAGTLTFIVGGDAGAVERARPVLAQMGRNIFHAGPAGAGQVAKICNNMLLGVLMAGTAEALALGVANGLDPKVLSEIIAKSSGRNWATEVYNPWPGVMEQVPASKGYAGGFGTDLMLKDLGLAAEAALSTRSAIPLGELARNLYALHSGAGNGKLDFSSILKMFKSD
jgi:3-hydroxyisobutyrate dehydrogenase